MQRFFYSICVFSQVVIGFSCTEGDDPVRPHEGDFGIYLIKTGERVLSDQEIAIYCGGNHTIKLNEDGINRMRTYIKWRTDVIPARPLLSELYHQDFQIKIKNEVIYSGKFSSAISSMLFEGIVIYDVVSCVSQGGLSIEYDKLKPGESDDPRNNSMIFRHFRTLGKFSE